jgi:hypothetical protein
MYNPAQASRRGKLINCMESLDFLFAQAEIHDECVNYHKCGNHYVLYA